MLPRPAPGFSCSVLLLGALCTGLAPPAQAAKAIFELSDPRGDDHGDGRLVYPLNSHFATGDLDLLSFAARRAKDGTWFDVTFARPVRHPGPGAADDLGTPFDQIARHGFYTVNVDVYIDLDRKPGSGGVAMLPGRRAEVAPEYAWDRAVALTPQPFEAQDLLERIFIDTLQQELRGEEGEPDKAEVRALRKELSSDLVERIYFPNRVRVQGPKLSFFVPDSFLGGPALPTWSYVVAVSGADLVQRVDMNLTDSRIRDFRESFMILPVSPDEWQNRFGGGRGSELEPPLIDILVPRGQSQEQLLRSYDSGEGRPVRLPGVVPAEQ